MKFLQRIPLFKSLRFYTFKDFRVDLLAGFTISILLIPQGISYAYLAGLPPQYGLYAGLVPLIVYALFASTPYLHIGPVALTSLLIISGISQINGVEVGSPAYIELVLLTGLLVGVFQFLLGVFKLGITANFLSRPVIAGFTSAAAIIIPISQFKDILGIKLGQYKFLHQKIFAIYQSLPETNLYSLALGLGSLALMYLMRSISRKIPSALIVLVLGAVIAYFFQLDNEGVKIIGALNIGLPSFHGYEFDMAKIKAISPTVLTLTIFGAVETLTISKAIASKDPNVRTKPNQEFIGIGLSKIFGAFFQAMPSSASFSRSAVAHNMRSNSAIVTIVSALAVAIVLLFLSHILHFVPYAILASIIIISVLNLFEKNEFFFLYKYHRRDFWNMAVTFLVTLVVGIEQGVLVGVILSIIKVLIKSAEPHIAILGQLPGTAIYKNVERFESAKVHANMKIVRFDDELYFANADFFVQKFKAFVRPNTKQIKVVVLDASGMNGIDSVGIRAFEEVLDFYTARDIEFNVCRAIGPVRDILESTGLMARLGSENNFMRIQDAVDDYHGVLS